MSKSDRKQELSLDIEALEERIAPGHMYGLDVVALDTPAHDPLLDSQAGEATPENHPEPQL